MERAPGPGPRRPRVIAHRGASEAAPEHTLRAYEQALREGADGLECDVRLTRDGVLVCIHDRRVDRVSNGRGVVSTLELADLAALDFSVRHGVSPISAGGEEPDRSGSRVLTLDRLLELVLDADRPVELAIETKHPTRYGALVERAVVDTLRRHGVDDPARRPQVHVRVMSFSALALTRLQQLAPVLPTVYLVRQTPRALSTGLLPTTVTALGPSIDLLRRRPGLVQRAHRRGLQVHVWTVNADGDVDRCRRLGAEVIITDRPRAVRSLLDDEPQPNRPS